MVVYAEVVFITNFCIDFFIFYLTLSLLKCRVKWKRLIIPSVIGGVFSAVMPLLFSYGFALKIIGVILFPFIIKKNKNIREYVVTLSVFVMTTFTLAGVFLLIKCCISNKIIPFFSYGLIPILFSLSGFICLVMVTELKKRYLSNVGKNIYERKIKIFVGDKVYTGEAFFDSGNRVFAKNGEPVTFVGERVYTMFAGEEKDIVLTTVSGNAILPSKEAKIMIYYENQDNIIYTTRIARASNLSENEIILNGALGG